MRNKWRLSLIMMLCIAMVMSFMALESHADESGNIQFTTTGAWFETAYAEWNAYEDATRYNVYYRLKSEADSAYQLVDEELVRNTRVDVLGLKGDTEYTIKVVAVKNSVELAESVNTFDVTPRAHERIGFAFSEHSPLGATTGGYNIDGTIHEEARILYITNDNKDTIQLEVVIDSKGKTQLATGLAEIFSLKQKKYDNVPMIVRIIGTVTSPANLPNPDTYNLLSAKRTHNITFEGVGHDARISGWGIEVREASNIEVRNLAFSDQPDDGISVQTRNHNLWFHHNEFFWGKDMGGDKTKGDGSIDIKTESTFVSVAYNVYHDTGKGMALGFSDPEQFYVTFHHNFFNASDSRHPRVTKGSVHVYNNYYYDIETYGVAAATNSHVFVENNYFEKVKRPMFISSQGHDLRPFETNHSASVWISEELGYRSNATEIVHPGNPNDSITSKNDGGAIKQVGNYMDKYSAAWFYEPFDSGNGGRGPVARPAEGWVYNEFDTSPIMYEYKAQSAFEAKETVLDLAGRLGADNRAVIKPQTNPYMPGHQDDDRDPGDVEDPGEQEKYNLALKDASLEGNTFLEAKVDLILDQAEPATGTIVFVFMDGQAPIGILSQSFSINQNESMAASIQVKGSGQYSVRIHVTDKLNADPTQIGTPLAKSVSASNN